MVETSMITFDEFFDSIVAASVLQYEWGVNKAETFFSNRTTAMIGLYNEGKSAAEALSILRITSMKPRYDHEGNVEVHADDDFGWPTPQRQTVGGSSKKSHH
jgi:hypothetical protein